MRVAALVMARASPDVVREVLEGARRFADGAVVVAAPGDPLLSAGLDAQVFAEPWRGYAATRTASLRRAREAGASWALMVDADPNAGFTRGSRMPDLDAADRRGVVSFEVAVEQLFNPFGRWRWYRGGHLLRTDAGLEWRGLGEAGLHEALVAPPDAAVVRAPTMVYRHDRRRPRAVAERAPGNDVARLEGPATTDPRAAFYHACALREAGRAEDAIAAFRRRSLMGGSREEVFWSLLWMAKLAAWTERPPRAIVQLHLLASAHSPDRAEPNHELAGYLLRLHRSRGLAPDELALARRCAERARACRYPAHARFFVDVGAYSDAALRRAGIDPRVDAE